MRRRCRGSRQPWPASRSRPRQGSSEPSRPRRRGAAARRAGRTATGRRARLQRWQEPRAVVGHGCLSLQEEQLHRRVIRGAGAVEQDARGPEVGDRLEGLDPLGAVVSDLALDRALDECQRVAGTLRDHRQQPHDEQRVEGGVAGAVDERRHAERRQWLHHRLEVGDRPRDLEARPIEQRLVVVEAGGLDAPAQGEGERSRGGLAETAEMELRRHAGEDVGHPRVGAEVRQQAVARPRPNEQAVDHHEARPARPTPARARASRSHSGPQPGIARMSHSIAGVLGLEVVVDLLAGPARRSDRRRPSGP